MIQRSNEVMGIECRMKTKKFILIAKGKLNAVVQVKCSVSGSHFHLFAALASTAFLFYNSIYKSHTSFALLSI